LLSVRSSSDYTSKYVARSVVPVLSWGDSALHYFVAHRRRLFCLAAILVSCSVGSVRSTEAAPPNIVFLFTDDHAYQAISAYGSTINHTPNLDRLAKEGMLFRNCYVTNSICGPSRAVILTGKYSHLNGFRTNGANERFDGSQQTFPKLLQAAGYQTAMIGKWHLVSDPTGFDFWSVLPGQGDYYNPKMIEMGKSIEVEGYCTDIVVDKSLEWLKKRDKSKPFLLMCQQKAPHRPWHPGPKYLNKYDDVTIPEPDTLFDDYSGRGKPAHTQDMTIAKTMNDVDLKFKPPGRLTPAQAKLWSEAYDAENEAFRKANLQGQDLVRWKYQRYIKDYLRCVDSVDENVGRVLKFLDDEKLADNTIVVYASDQGFYLGEHGWFDKRWIYEQSVKTPFLVRWPKVAKPGSVNESVVANLDFGATLLEAAGVAVPGDMQGRSVVPLLKGESPADWRTSFYYHYYEFPGPHAVRKHYGVVERRYKLVHFYEPDVNEWEMYDLQADPKELRSVFADPKYAKERARLEAELKRLRTDLKVPERDEPKGPPRAADAPGGKKGNAAGKAKTAK
jgi:arylsulfatase A-like enzyme